MLDSMNAGSGKIGHGMNAHSSVLCIAFGSMIMMKGSRARYVCEVYLYGQLTLNFIDFDTDLNTKDT